MPSLHRDRISGDQHGVLESILTRAIDPAAIEDVLRQFTIEKTLLTPLTDAARYSRARIVEIHGIAYILCPVPQFYNEENHLETGFAIDVDQDHFDVYPFLFNTSTGEYKILTRLPHCVVRAIKMNARDYDAIAEEIKEVANEASAILFISNLYTELEVNSESPVEFFDNRLFQQLIGKVLSINEHDWMNTRLVVLRFDQLRHQIDRLDNAASFYSDSLQRLLLGMARFLVETIRVIGSECIFELIDKETVSTMGDQLMAALLETGDISIAKELAGYIGQIADMTSLRSMLARFVAHGYYDHVMVLERAAGRFIDKNDDVVKRSFSIALEKGIIDKIHDIEAFFATPFNIDNASISRAINNLVRKGNITSAQELKRICGENCKLDLPSIREAYSVLILNGKISDAVALETWTGEKYEVNEQEVQHAARYLFMSSHIEAAMNLLDWTGISNDPAELDVQAIYTAIFHGPSTFTAQLDLAKRFESWSGLFPRHDVIMHVYRALFSAPAAKDHSVENAMLLEAWTGTRPAADLVQEMHSSLFQAMHDDERLITEMRSLATWTGVMPRDAAVIAEYKHYLKNLQFKASNIAIACKLIEWTGLIPPETLLQEAFSSLLAVPLKSTAIDDAAMLSSMTGIKPLERIIQEAYQCILEYRVIDPKTMPVDAAKSLHSWTGIEPNQDIAMLGMNAAIIRFDIASAKAIESWTGEKPDKDVIIEAYKSGVQNPRRDGKWYHDIQEMVSWTGIYPGKDIVQDAYEVLLLRRKISPEAIDAAASLASFTDIHPSEEVLRKVRLLLAREEDLGYEREETTKALLLWLKRLEIE